MTTAAIAFVPQNIDGEPLGLSQAVIPSALARGNHFVDRDDDAGGIITVSFAPPLDALTLDEAAAYIAELQTVLATSLAAEVGR